MLLSLLKVINKMEITQNKQTDNILFEIIMGKHKKMKLTTNYPHFFPEIFNILFSIIKYSGITIQ